MTIRGLVVATAMLAVGCSAAAGAPDALPADDVVLGHDAPTGDSAVDERALDAGPPDDVVLDATSDPEAATDAHARDVQPPTDAADASPHDAGPVTYTTGDPCTSSYPAVVTNAAGVTTSSCTMTVGPDARTYILHVPTSYRVGNPVILGFHGAGPGAANRAFQGTMAPLDALADANGFITVYPLGYLASNGNYGWCGGFGA